MAVSLPPPLTPQPGNVEELRPRADDAVTLQYREYTLHVFGSTALQHAKLLAAIAGADSLSNAVRALAGAYYAAGYPAAQLTYAIAGRDLYILVTLGRVTTAAGPQYLTDYFSGMDASAPLTDSRLEPRRTLASLHADRAGENATPLLIRQADGTYQLDLKPDREGPGQTTVRASIGNPGNRFSGRHFGDLDVRQNTRWGDEFHFLGRRAITTLNHDNSGARYAEYDLSWNRVTPYGVFGLAASNTHYHVTLPDVALGDGTVADLPTRGDLTTAEVDGFGLLAGGYYSRWTAQTRLGRTDKRLDAAQFGDLQHELYNWAEISTLYSLACPIGGQRLAIEFGGAVGKGFSPHEPAVATEFRYLLWKPGVKLQLQTSLALTATLEASGQASRDTLPEQQQWILGGLTNGAAFLPGLAVGDSGGNVRGSLEHAALELRQHYRLVPKIFAEYAYAAFSHPNTVQGALGLRPAIADAGVNLALAAYDWLDLELTYAEGFYHDDLAPADLHAARARLYFSVTGKFGS